MIKCHGTSIQRSAKGLAQWGSARTGVIGPMRGALPTPYPKDQTRPAHRELHALLFAIDVWVR